MGWRRVSSDSGSDVEPRDRAGRALDAAGGSWWEFDVDTGEFSFGDRKATALGYDPDAFESLEDFRDLVHDDDEAYAAAAFDAVVDGDRDRYDVTYRIRTADDTYEWMHDVGTLTTRTDDESRRLSGITIAASSPVDQATLEDRNEALALVNRIVRHDIRNDLNVIKGWLELFADDPTFITDDRVDELVTVVDESIALTESIRDVVAMVEADDVETEPVPAGRILADETERVRAAYPNATIEHADLPTTPVVANALLSSVYRNLLANAIEHADHDDVTVTVDGHVDDDTVVFTIADDGPGIDDARKAVLFDATATTVDQLDHGLGLYLVNALVSAYGGTVDVADNDPTGTVVTVALRAA
jgi:signal transduction histidine kinase